MYVVIEGVGIYRYAAEPPFKIETFNISPAFFPVILGGTLIFLSLILFLRSLRGTGGFSAALINTLTVIAAWLTGLPKDPDIRNMALGIVIMGIYSYLLIKLLHFPLASLVFLIGLMAFLRAAKIWRIILRAYP